MGAAVTQQEGQVIADAQPVQTPDGTVHVGVVMAAGGGQYTVVIPADAVDAWVDQFAAKVREVSAAARRANSGIVIAATLNGNGHRTPPPSLLRGDHLLRG